MSNYSRRKPVPEQDNGDSSFPLKNNKPATDLSFMNQPPRMPAKSPLRNSGSVTTSGSTQTTIIQPVMSTMSITSAASPTSPTVRTRPSVDTGSIDRDLLTSEKKDYEESIRSLQSKRRGSDHSFKPVSPTSIVFSDNANTTSPPLSPKVKPPSLNIAVDLLASSEAILASATSPKFPPGTSLLDTTDEMLIQLLVSQAIIDAKDFDILSLEEVEELKKDYSLLTTRITALTSKLSLESKIREAASSLARLHASNRRLSRQATDHLSAANRKVDQVATELWKLTQRAGEVQRKLLQHMAGILSTGISKLEEKHTHPFQTNSIQIQEGGDGIDNLYNEIMGINSNGSDPILIEKVSSLETSLHNAHQTLAEARMAIKRKDKELEELKAKLDETATEARERTIAELRTELEEVGSRLDILLRKHKANNGKNSTSSDNEYSDESDSGGSTFYRLSTMTTATQHLQKEQYRNISENLSALEKALEIYAFRVYKSEQELNSTKTNPDDENSQSQLQEALDNLKRAEEKVEIERKKVKNMEDEIFELQAKAERVQDLEDQIKEMDRKNRVKGSNETSNDTNVESKLRKTEREYDEIMEALKKSFSNLPSDRSEDNKARISKETVISRIQRVGDENKRLMDQISHLQSRMHEHTMKLKDQENLKRVLEDTQIELENSKSRIMELEDKAQNAISRATSTNEKQSDLRNELEDLREQLSTSQEKIRKYEAILKRQSVIQIVDNGTSIKEEFQQQLAAQEQEYEAQIKERDAIISKIRSDLSHITTEKENLAQVVKDLEDMLKSKSRTLDQREVTISRLEGDVVRLKSELAELKAATDGISDFNQFNTDGRNSRTWSQVDEKQELIQLRSIKAKLEQQVKKLKENLVTAQKQFSEREEALEKRSETNQNELDGILREFDRLTRNFIDFDAERQKLQKNIDQLQSKREALENELADEKIKHLGMDGNEPITTTTLRKEFRKMMADSREEHSKLLRRETEEKKKLEATVRNLKREKEAEKWEKANKGTQTRFTISIGSG
ncbi:involucrin repeat protein [Gigaspora margarita]|uniref:Involucrin repeat protein n=1 Tax=Gigaspora margarita TaxID=4874 RepID=A0A8H4A215_GIGMA|nr:involucrin repeat protein [Gigaspora margarita]